MNIENKTNHALWSASFYDETAYPSWWKKEWGTPIELWLIENAGQVRLYMTKERIIHKVNEDMRGRIPIWHVWNLRTDRHVFCGQNQQEAYTVYQQEIEKERSHDRNRYGNAVGLSGVSVLRLYRIQASLRQCMYRNKRLEAA